MYRVTLAILLTLILTACGEPPLHRSDADMEHTFLRHRHEFFRVLNMAEQDRAHVLWIRTHEMQPSDASLPEERWEQYDEICGELGVRRVERRDGQVELDVSSEGDDFSHGIVKGYVFSTTRSLPLTASLDTGVPEHFLHGRNGIAYKELSSNWYLFVRQD